MSRSLDGKPLAKAIRQTVSDEVAALQAQGVTPTLAIVVATDDEQAAWYVRSLVKAASACGITARTVDCGARATTQELTATLQKLAADSQTHGIILQTPLPPTVTIDDLLPLIPIEKDVDGANPTSAGQLSFDLPTFAPATAEAVLALLEHYAVPLDGSQAVIIGRSRVVGKPLASLLLRANATVTVCHSHTQNLAELAAKADVLVAAAGQPKLVTAAYVTAKSIVIDVGTNVTDSGELAGDVDPAIADKVAALTPVPGGIGPVTTALLLQHTVQAAGLSTKTRT